MTLKEFKLFMLLEEWSFYQGMDPERTLFWKKGADVIRINPIRHFKDKPPPAITITYHFPISASNKKKLYLLSSYQDAYDHIQGGNKDDFE